MARTPRQRSTASAVALLPPDHPNAHRVSKQIIDHATAGRAALAAGKMIECGYHRSCCSNLLWRLGVDGLTSDDQLRIDAAKYETRLPGRLSSSAARAIRESAELRHRSQSALKNLVACDHIVPRTCVADVLIGPHGVDLDDFVWVHSFLYVHAEVAILSPDENESLRRGGLESDMPEAWWRAPADEKANQRMSRYRAVGIEVTPGQAGGPPALPGPPGAAPASAAGAPRNSKPSLEVKWFDPGETLAVMHDLDARHGMTPGHFRQLHHGGGSLGGHRSYCERHRYRGGRFTTGSNAYQGLRLEHCLRYLDEGRSWEDAIALALAAVPIERA